MTREEFSKLVKGMKAVYADPKFIADKYAFDVWYSMLKDIPYNVASLSVQTYIMTNKFPPTIADIREQAFKNTEEPKGLNSNEAWALVMKALCNSNYHAQEEFDKLPPLVQKSVGSADNLRTLAGSSDFNEEVEKSLFTKTYNAVAKREQEDMKLPENIRQLINNSNQNRIGANRWEEEEGQQ